jgi:hypothetical protein
VWKEQKQSLPVLLDGRNRLDGVEAAGMTIDVDVGTDADPHVKVRWRDVPNGPWYPNRGHRIAWRPFDPNALECRETAA